MPVRQTPSQKAIVSRVMGEFKEGRLDKRDGEPVTDPKQAIAIALHEAGASDRESPESNRRSLRRTRRATAPRRRTRALSRPRPTSTAKPSGAASPAGRR